MEWEWYSDVNTCRLFIHMILKANWKDGNFRGKKVPRGSFVSSIHNLSEETSLTEREVRTAISHLKTTGEVTSRSTNKFTVFSIKNYDIYQSSDMQAGIQETNERHSNDIQETNERHSNDIQKTNERHSNDIQKTNERHSNDILTTTIEEGKNDRMKERKEGNIDCTEPEKSALVPAVIELALNDKTFYPITQKDINDWTELYPAVDVMQELRKMKGWCDSNPTKRKTSRGIKRFITNWLAREQDKGGKSYGEKNTETESTSSVRLW